MISVMSREQCAKLGLPHFSHAYIGKRPCGCVLAAAIDNPNDPRQTLDDINEFLESGLILARVPIGETQLSDACRHTEKP